MKRVQNKYLLSLLMGFAFFACADEPKQNEVEVEEIKSVPALNNLNVSILLDLSDRINPTKYPNSSMDYYKRDANYIKSVSETFDSHLRNKKVREMDDKIQLFFEPEPSNQNINTISNGLKYKVNRKNASLKVLDEIKNTYATKPLKIYELAIKDDKYVGSDTWGFFKTKVRDYCIDEDYRNILVILTDGYIYHKDGIIKDENKTTYITPQYIRESKLNTKDWKNKMIENDYAFIPVNEDLSNLEILVLGINPDNKNPFEEDVIKKYWSDWFNAMKVKRYDIKTAELPSNLDEIIREFILYRE